MDKKYLIFIPLLTFAFLSFIPNVSHATGTSAPYDEQLGMTFVQNFTALGYNVTAVAQTSGTSGTGPGYLLNGLSNTGYWYQVGLSWNWATFYGYSPNQFLLSYEIWSPNGTSIYPTNGGAGTLDLSGPVNEGDIVLLNLYFKNNTVILLVKDWNTGATGSITFPAYGATEFVGSPNYTANNNGFFTGLMTEWYGTDSNFPIQQQVTYSPYGTITSPAWLWADEFYCEAQPCYQKSAIGYNKSNSFVYPTSPHYLTFTPGSTEEYTYGGVFITGATPPAPFYLLSSNIENLQTDAGIELRYSITVSVAGGTPPYIYAINFNGKQYEIYPSNSTSITIPFYTVSLTPGTYNYNVTVTDNNGHEVSSPNGQIQINNPPQISLNAKQTTIDAGKQLTVNYNITGGTPPFNVSYFLNGENVGTSLNISKAGTYYLYAQLSDGAGYITNSSQISITVNPPPQINLHLNKTTIDFGQTLKPYYNITGGTEPFNVSYFLNGENIGSTLTIPSAGNYSVYARIIDRYGLVANSLQINFKVNPKPTISIKYNRTITDVDTPIKLVAIGNYGTPPYSYKWYVNNQPIASSNTTYSLLENKSGNYVVFASIIDSVGGTNNSSQVTFIVNKLPNASRLNVQPSSSLLFINNSANVAVSVSGGSPPYIYKWYVNGIFQNNSNSSYYTLRNLKSGNNNVTVEVIDAYGNKAYSSYVIATSINYTLIIGVVVVGLIIVGGLVYFLIKRKPKEGSVTNYVADSNKMKEDEAKEDDVIN